MTPNLQFVIYDPASDTKVVWDMEGQERFGITLKKLTGDLVNKIADRTGQSPVQILTHATTERWIVRVEPKGTK